MDTLHFLLNVFLHLDLYLGSFVHLYGDWLYPLLFLIIFCETGLLFFPFLPGDSLLFATGTLAAVGSLNIHGLVLLLTLAAFGGNLCNYGVGRFLGGRLFYLPNAPFYKAPSILKTQDFYEKHGGKAIIIGRFLPIIRTFVPFVGGLSLMNFKKFMVYSGVGAVLWITLFLYMSYYFGNLPFVRQHFSYIILMILILSLIPSVYEILRQQKRGNAP